jgi:hypothetical protein
MSGEMMKCAEFSRIVQDLARSRGLTEAEAAIARAHAEICPSCGFRLAEAQEVATALRKASVECRSLTAPDRVESALMAAFRASKAETSRGSKPRWRLALGWGAAVAALAFALLIRAPGHSSTPAATGLAHIAMRGSGAKTSGSQPVADSENASAASASGFVPVPFAGGFARGDSGVIVRVQVPRAALAELGYPVDDAQGGGVVQADLLVGEDGWPRAVRIVH